MHTADRLVADALSFLVLRHDGNRCVRRNVCQRQAVVEMVARESKAGVLSIRNALYTYLALPIISRNQKQAHPAMMVMMSTMCFHRQKRVRTASFTAMQVYAQALFLHRRCPYRMSDI